MGPIDYLGWRLDGVGTVILIFFDHSAGFSIINHEAPLKRIMGIGSGRQFATVVLFSPCLLLTVLRRGRGWTQTPALWGAVGAHFGPLLFKVYIKLLDEITCQRNIKYHKYGIDTQFKVNQVMISRSHPNTWRWRWLKWKKTGNPDKTKWLYNARFFLCQEFSIPDEFALS